MDMTPTAFNGLTDRQRRWFGLLFAAQSVDKGGVVRRSVSSVQREVGIDLLQSEVRARGFHIVCCGGQYVIICNTGHMQVIC